MNSRNFSFFLWFMIMLRNNRNLFAKFAITYSVVVRRIFLESCQLNERQIRDVNSRYFLFMVRIWSCERGVITLYISRECRNHCVLIVQPVVCYYPFEYIWRNAVHIYISAGNVQASFFNWCCKYYMRYIYIYYTY